MILFRSITNARLIYENDQRSSDRAPQLIAFSDYSLCLYTNFRKHSDSALSATPERPRFAGRTHTPLGKAWDALRLSNAIERKHLRRTGSQIREGMGRAEIERERMGRIETGEQGQRRGWHSRAAP